LNSVVIGLCKVYICMGPSWNLLFALAHSSAVRFTAFAGASCTAGIPVDQTSSSLEEVSSRSAASSNRLAVLMACWQKVPNCSIHSAFDQRHLSNHLECIAHALTHQRRPLTLMNTSTRKLYPLLVKSVLPLYEKYLLCQSVPQGSVTPIDSIVTAATGRSKL